MAKKSDFTYEEWDLLDDVPYLVGISVAKADYSTTSYAKEFVVLCDACRDAKERYKDNELLIAILSERMPEDSDDDMHDHLTMDEFFAILKRALDLIDSKCSAEEARQFREFLYWLAEGVAKAAKEGLFNLGKLISKKEADHLARLREHLGLTGEREAEEII
jgi:hypothetical protein